MCEAGAARALFGAGGFPASPPASSAVFFFFRRPNERLRSMPPWERARVCAVLTALARPAAPHTGFRSRRRHTGGCYIRSVLFQNFCWWFAKCEFTDVAGKGQAETRDACQARPGRGGRRHVRARVRLPRRATARAAERAGGWMPGAGHADGSTSSHLNRASQEPGGRQETAGTTAEWLGQSHIKQTPPAPGEARCGSVSVRLVTCLSGDAMF